MESPRSVLLISCPDRPGLIHQITGVMFRHGLNIIENHEHVDRGHDAFFMRTEFSGTFQEGAVLSELAREIPTATDIRILGRRPKRLVLLGTREPHCLGDLLLRHASGSLHAEILGVVSQYDSLAPLVKRFELPFTCVPVKEGAPREEHEHALARAVDLFKPDYLVLAKYMRILSPAFVARYPNRILNIHHSFLPAFIGKNPYAQAHERGVKIIGATAHFVNENLDEGPIITQSVIPVNHTLDAAALARAGRDVEQIVLARALSLVLEDRVLVHGSRTLVFE